MHTILDNLIFVKLDWVPYIGLSAFQQKHGAVLLCPKNSISDKEESIINCIEYCNNRRTVGYHKSACQTLTRRHKVMSGICRCARNKFSRCLTWPLVIHCHEDVVIGGKPGLFAVMISLAGSIGFKNIFMLAAVVLKCVRVRFLRLLCFSLIMIGQPPERGYETHNVFER